MALFHFSGANEIASGVKYLASFDRAIKFVLSQSLTSCTLRVCTVDVPPSSFSELLYTNISSLVAVQTDLPLINGAITWSVDANFLHSVLSCFEGHAPLTIEVQLQNSRILLFQQDDGCARTQVAHVGILHNVGPDLQVEHNVEQAYVIQDLNGFRQLCSSMAYDGAESCRVELQWGGDDGSVEDHNVCTLVCVTETTCFKLRLGKTKPKPSCLIESVRCADLCSFASLCSVISGQTEKQLSLGFSEDGLALFQYRWSTANTCFRRTATLFLCSSL